MFDGFSDYGGYTDDTEPFDLAAAARRRAAMSPVEDNPHGGKARTNGAASGAMTGASLGSAAGPAGALIGSLLGGAVGAVSPGSTDQLGSAGGALVDAAKRKKKDGWYRGSFDENPGLTPEDPDFLPEVF